jgi:hypothetical protein
MNEKEIGRLAGELVVAMYNHGGAVPHGPTKVAELAVKQARALAQALRQPEENETNCEIRPS